MLRQALLYLMSGNEAIAHAVMDADVDVVAAYPITPQTTIVEKLSEYVASGMLDAEFVPVESEHSALSVCLGASLTGARVFTATSSQGLALMHEILYIASGLRTPIVMAIANRALSAPINIHGDHSDIMGSRDAGWIQLFAENPQQAYDFTLIAYRVAEDNRVMLPVAVNVDGFTVSHCYEGVRVLGKEDARAFLPRTPRPRLEYETPITVGAMFSPMHYHVAKTEQAKALESSLNVVKEVFRSYPMREEGYDVVHAVNTDSPVMVVGLGGVMGTFRHLGRRMNVGVASLRLYRPFPAADLLPSLREAELIIVLDRAYSPGAPAPPLAADIKTLLHTAGLQTPVWSVVCGLGGHEIRLSMAEKLLQKALKAVREGAGANISFYLGEEVNTP